MYYPVIRWKTGEQQALKHLNIKLKDKITPIIEMPFLGKVRPKNHYELQEEAQERQQKTFFNKINSFSKVIVSCWGKNKILLDCDSVLKQENVTSTLAELKTLFDIPNTIIPVIKLFNIENDLLEFVKELYTNSRVETIAFRINFNFDFNNIEMLYDVSKQIAIDTNKIILIIDLEDISDKTVVQCEADFKSIYNKINADFAEVIFLSGALSIPSDFGKNTSDYFERTDWLGWKKLKNKSKYENLQFGDYGIDSAKFVDVPYPGAPKIKYTFEDKWIVFKGVKPKGGVPRNYDQYKEMSKQLVKLEGWRIPTCYGEKMIADCAKGDKEVGSPTKWVEIGLNQHISFVVSQLDAI